ncbi:MAG: hypothetical protein H6741_23015 [Alphaproteobacteria bacterium]|nr:hypothetical protein [Alphaproteobacteria bacterium]
MHLLLLAASLAWASPKSELTTGVVACDNDQPEAAVEKLRSAMSQADQLKEKDLAKGWYYLGRCSIRLLVEGADEPKLALEAADALVAARAADSSGRYAERIALEWSTLRVVLFNLGALVSDPTAPAELKPLALQAIDRLLAWDPQDYLALTLKAHAHLAADEHAEMGEAAMAAIAAYEAQPPERPDPSVGLLGFMAANAYGLYLEEPDLETALDAIQRSRALLEGMQGQADAAAVSSGLADLRSAELNLYLSHPELHEQAISRFEAALQETPDDTSIKLGLAVVVELSDPARARGLYEEVTAADPDNLEAWFNLGASYINEALQVNKQMLETMSPPPELEARYAELSAKGRVAMENAHRLDPKNEEVLRQLERLAIEAGDDEAFKAYKAKREALKAGR